MARRLSFFFDGAGDILYLSLGKPRPALSREIGEDIVLRLDPKTKEVVGCTILNLTKRFGKMRHPENLPVSGDLALAR